MPIVLDGTTNTVTPLTASGVATFTAGSAAAPAITTAGDTNTGIFFPAADTIAFAGQVPVNVLGATAGQYIIPVNDNGAIKGEAISSPTFEQYQTAVGKVIAIEADGRAKIIVKVA